MVYTLKEIKDLLANSKEFKTPGNEIATILKREENSNIHYLELLYDEEE